MKKSTFLVLFLALLICSACTKQLKITCGIGEVAQRGINHLQPMIDAMERYKADHGKYPTADTTDFAPQYIKKIPILSCVPPSSEISPIAEFIEDEDLCSSTSTSEKDGSSFMVKFYPNDERLCLLGGRNNICEYTSETKEWKCYMH